MYHLLPGVASLRLGLASADFFSPCHLLFPPVPRLVPGHRRLTGHRPGERGRSGRILLYPLQQSWHCGALPSDPRAAQGEARGQPAAVGQVTKDAPRVDTWWVEGWGGASESVCTVVVTAAAVRCHPRAFLQRLCWGGGTCHTSHPESDTLSTPLTNLALDTSREAVQPLGLLCPTGEQRHRVRDIVRDETERWWDWEPQEGDSSVREALPNASSGLQAPPAFLERPKEEYFQEVGRELLIPCSARGDPPPTVSWAKVRLLSCFAYTRPSLSLPLHTRVILWEGGRGKGKVLRGRWEEAGAARREKWRPW